MDQVVKLQGQPSALLGLLVGPGFRTSRTDDGLYDLRANDIAVTGPLAMLTYLWAHEICSCVLEKRCNAVAVDLFPTWRRRAPRSPFLAQLARLASVALASV